MKKPKEKSLRDNIAKALSIKSNGEATDNILVDELIDFMKISEYAKAELESDPGNWQSLTTITMASKQIQSILTKLGLTPQERNKIKVLEKANTFDMNKFLKGEN